MSRSFDAVIVGGGFAGAATAYHLTRRGLKNVLLVEREEQPGLHASGRNASLAFQGLADETEEQLALEGREFIGTPPAGFADDPLLRECGSLLLWQEDAGRAESTPHGVPTVTLSRAEAVSRVPLLADAPFARAVFTPSDGVIDIRALLHGFLGAAAHEGAEILYRALLTGVETRGGAVAAVATSAGRFETPLLVNAAGAWAGVVGRLASVGPRTLEPRRRHMYRAQVDVRIDPSWPFVWNGDIDVYFRPDRGELLMSPCDATSHGAEDPQVDDAVEQILFDKLRRAFPSLAGATLTTRWACLRTFTSDERFLIGPDPDLEGLVWVAGLGGHGVTTSPAVGRLGAAACLGEHPRGIDSFLPQRLTAGAERQDAHV